MFGKLLGVNKIYFNTVLLIQYDIFLFLTLPAFNNKMLLIPWPWYYLVSDQNYILWYCPPLLWGQSAKILDIDNITFKMMLKHFGSGHLK